VGVAVGINNGRAVAATTGDFVGNPDGACVGANVTHVPVPVQGVETIRKKSTVKSKKTQSSRKKQKQ
jgi:hypothetical protein